MSEMERRLRDLGEKARTEMTKSPSPRASALRRIRLRRAVISGAAVLSVGAIAIGGVVLAADPREAADVRPAQEQTEAPDPHAHSFAGVWPEVTVDDARRACAESPGAEGRTEAAALATRFARDVLGWERPRLSWEQPSVAGSPPRDHRTIEARPAYGSPFDVSIRPGVVLSMKRVLPRCWSVTGVSRLSDRRPTGFGIAVRGRAVELSFEPFGAASASIEIAYGEDGNRRRSTSWERGQGIVTVDLGFEPDTPGAVLVLLKDADGKVFTAIGTPLPPGDFAAG